MVEHGTVLCFRNTIGAFRRHVLPSVSHPSRDCCGSTCCLDILPSQEAHKSSRYLQDSCITRRVSQKRLLLIDNFRIRFRILLAQIPVMVLVHTVVVVGNFSDEFDFYFHLSYIHYHNLKQRKINIELVCKISNPKKFKPQHMHAFNNLLFGR